MKRGFFLKAKDRKAQKQSEPSASTAGAVQHESGPQNPKGFDTDLKKNLANASDYDRNDRYRGSNGPGLLQVDENVAVVISIPHPVPDHEIQCEWIVKGSTKKKVLNARGYPARIPIPRRPNLYEIKSTSDIGEGLFAKFDIKRGELILAERPLLVIPRSHIIMESEGAMLDHQRKHITISEFESVLEATIARFPPESHADFRALHNSHTSDGCGPLLGIVRTNGYTTINLYDGSNTNATYTALLKTASRINNSCTPNLKSSFKLNSFSMQFYALRDIKAGDQLFCCYCPADCNVSERQFILGSYYGFVCKCPACVNATPESDKLRKTFDAQITDFRQMVIYSQVNEAMLEEALRLEKAMVKEGLDGHFAFESLTTVIFLVYLKLGRLGEGEKYGHRIEEFRKCAAGEE